jgi:hypothetical protein
LGKHKTFTGEAYTSIPAQDTKGKHTQAYWYGSCFGKAYTSTLAQDINRQAYTSILVRVMFWQGTHTSMLARIVI